MGNNTKMTEKASSGKIAFRIISGGCGCGIIGAISCAALIALSSSSKQMGAGYEWIGFAVVGSFTFGGLLSGFIGIVLSSILNLRRTQPKIAGWICIATDVLFVGLLYYLFTDIPLTLKDFNPKTLSGKETLAWFLGITIIFIIPLFYSGVRLIQSGQRADD